MNLTQKRILADAEARMTSTTGPALSPEAQARYERMGIFPDTPWPERCRIIAGVIKGQYPPGMTQADIELYQRINAEFEAEYY